jgi:hypothetical protein
MNRQRVLKVVLVLVGLLFVAGIYPLVTAVWSELKPHEENTVPMMLSLYVTLGVFLLLAARNPSTYRSVIAFAAWSSVAHAAVMGVMSLQLPDERVELLTATAALGLIGALLIALAPGRETARGGGEHAAAIT